VDLTFLGTGSAFVRDAFNAGYVIDRRVMIDAGPASHVLVPRSGNDVGDIEAFVITHLHGDHTFGLPAVMASRAIDSAGAPPVVIAGPPGLDEHLDKLFHLAWGDRLRTLVWKALQPRFIEMHPGEDLDIAGFRVHAEQVTHVPELQCFGYTFEKDGVRFGFSGDCAVCPGLDALVERSEHFLIEMTTLHQDPTHLSRSDVEKIVRAHPDKHFYLTHLTTRDPLEGAILAEDLQTVELR
jgi:ribonuclease BN (tRNA processing enzyme)